MLREIWRSWTRIPAPLRRAFAFLFAGVVVGRLLLPIWGGTANDIYSALSSVQLSFDIFVLAFSLFSLIIWGIFEVRREGQIEVEEALRDQNRVLLEETISLKTHADNMEIMVTELELDMDRDSTTGIPNERKFNDDYLKSIDETDFEQFCLIYLDLDGFGEIDKELNWMNADRVIRTISQNIRSDMRRNENIFRSDVEAYRRHTGGDEFIIILKGTEKDALSFVRFRLPALFSKTSNELEDLLVGRRLSFSGAMKWFSKREVARIRSMNESGRMAVVHDALLSLHDLTNKAKKNAYGTWFLWESLPFEKFGKDASENLSAVSMELGDQSSFFEFFFTDTKSKNF